MTTYPVATVATNTNGGMNPPSFDPNTTNSSTIIWGIPVDEHTVDSSFVKTTRNILRISILSGVFAALSAIVSFALSSNAQGGIITALLIPLCGYLGVKNKNKTLIKLFCYCNCFCVFIFIVSTITIVQVTLPVIQCVCAKDCDSTVLDGLNRPGGRNNGLPGLNDNSTILTAEWEEICERESDIEQTYIVAIALGAIMAIMQCYGCLYSKKLLDSSYFAIHSPVSQFAVVGSPVMTYPQNISGGNTLPIMYGYPGISPYPSSPNGSHPVMVPYPMSSNAGIGSYPPPYPPGIGPNTTPYPPPGMNYPPPGTNYPPPGSNYPPPGTNYPPPGLQMRTLYPPTSSSTPSNNAADVPSKIPPSYTMVQGYPPVTNGTGTVTTTTTTITAPSYNDDNPRN